MKAKLQKRLASAIDQAYRRTGEHSGDTFARGLSSEGYVGGYAAALNDVILLLNGTEPDDPRGLWREGRLAERRAKAKRAAKARVLNINLFAQ